MSSLADLHPVLGLRVRAGDLELRGLTDDDLLDLCELAHHGIHDPARMPFAQPWTDAPPDELTRRTSEYHWLTRATWSPQHWSLQLGVWRDGQLVGCQGLEARDYLVTHTAETGSWLGLAHQGQGIGTAMRRVICAFAFDHLDAVEVTSSAFADNPASLAVSRAVGYLDNGTNRMQRRPGELAHEVRLTLTRDALVRGPELQVEGLAPVRRVMGLPA